MSNVLASLAASTTTISPEEQVLASPPVVLSPAQLREKVKAAQAAKAEQRRLEQLGVSPEPPAPTIGASPLNPASPGATSVPQPPRAYAQQGPTPAELAAYYKGIDAAKAQMTDVITMEKGGALLVGIAGTLAAVVVVYGLYSGIKWMTKPAAAAAKATA